ncbi:hypothetical protein A1OQ_20435 [Enterovibrio norvegicus FF-162]|nr:hypothetical protein A1OQ_20435 [Enterovibrio norvegicus FF-162]
MKRDGQCVNGNKAIVYHSDMFEVSKVNRVIFSNVAATMLAVFTAPQAVADLYAGAMVSYANVESRPSSDAAIQEATPILLQAQAGYFFNDYLALEGRYGTSLQRTDGMAVNSVASAYVKGNIPVTNQIAMYALAGYVATDIDNAMSGSVSESGASFGLGMHYALSSETAVTFEFINVPSSGSNNDNVGLSALNLGFQYRF